MRTSALLAATAIVLLAGCQQTSTTSSTTSSTGATSSNAASSPPPAASATPPPAAPAAGTTAAAPTFDQTTDKSMEIATASGGSARLQYKDLKVGDGTIAESGKTVMVQYTGWLTDGTKFDSSYDHGQPFQFQLGAGQVIPGWDKVVAGMRAGGKRRLVIPSQLGYGSQGAGGVIPPNATLVFEVELLGVH